MAKPITDQEVIKSIGVEALVAAGFSEWAVLKWMAPDRGIPWKERAVIADIAREKRIRIPDDFLRSRRRAA